MSKTDWNYDREKPNEVNLEECKFEIEGLKGREFINRCNGMTTSIKKNHSCVMFDKEIVACLSFKNSYGSEWEMHRCTLNPNYKITSEILKKSLEKFKNSEDYKENPMPFKAFLNPLDIEYNNKNKLYSMPFKAFLNPLDIEYNNKNKLYSDIGFKLEKNQKNKHYKYTYDPNE